MGRRWLPEMTRGQMAALVSRYHVFDGQAARLVRQAVSDTEARELVQGAIDAGELPIPRKNDLHLLVP